MHETNSNQKGSQHGNLERIRKTRPTFDSGIAPRVMWCTLELSHRFSRSRPTVLEPSLGGLVQRERVRCRVPAHQAQSLVLGAAKLQQQVDQGSLEYDAKSGGGWDPHLECKPPNTNSQSRERKRATNRRAPKTGGEGERGGGV